jgi:hypothetical protein
VYTFKAHHFTLHVIVMGHNCCKNVCIRKHILQRVVTVFTLVNYNHTLPLLFNHIRQIQGVRTDKFVQDVLDMPQWTSDMVGQQSCTATHLFIVHTLDVTEDSAWIKTVVTTAIRTYQSPACWRYHWTCSMSEQQYHSAQSSCWRRNLFHLPPRDHVLLFC